ncbi:mediator of RNA polymerase II transcription subunit 13 [Podila epicladia]|nr:mediator of RNA polymerase II transcription subunit 13 [Podila epicladia]KAG0084211.1 mediator of RNA polymerase II transcription subunit 13 [Podila epicladia]
MAWDSILRGGAIPLGSTPRPHSTSNVNQEYEIFISGLRNVLDRGMLVKGGYRLGDAYVFPTSLQPRLDGSILPAFPKMPPMTMLSLVLSPHGTSAVLRPKEIAEFSEERTLQCLEEWSRLFGTNQSQEDGMLPRLVPVAVKSGENEILLQYPTERVFVPLSLKESPSDVGQLDGMGSRNLGFIEDLGAKFAMWSWQEKTRNAIAAPPVPKLVQPVSDYTPVLAEPRNRLKAGSSAWQQQQHQIQQQQLQQQQQQQAQQQQQTFFLQQQQDALVKREANLSDYDTNRIDYWSYTDPNGYLTSLVLNSCANTEPKTADSPSAEHSTLIVPPPTKPTKVKKSTTISNTAPSPEMDGWIRRKPKKVTAMSPSVSAVSAVETADTKVVSSDTPAQASTNVPSIQPTTHVKSESVQVETQASATSYPIQIDMQGDSMSEMSGMLDMTDMNSLMGLYSGGNNDDLGDDWGEVTQDDFSFFDEQPRAPARSLPMVLSSAFDTPAAQSSIPATTSNLVIPTSTSAISDALLGTFSEANDPLSKVMSTDSLLNDDSLFMNMDLDLASFAQPTPPLSAITPLGMSGLGGIFDSKAGLSPAVEQAIVSQLSHDISMLTPTPQVIPDHELKSLGQQPSTSSTEQALVKKTPSLFVEHMPSPTQSFIPSIFSPLKIIGGYFVDESKYQEGGRFVYRRLYKRRKSSIPTSHRHEMKMLPFYQPGKDQEWIAPKTRAKQTKPRPRLSAPGLVFIKKEAARSVATLPIQSPISPMVKQEVNIPNGLILRPNQPSWSSTPQAAKRKNEDASSSDSDSDSSSGSSSGDSDDEHTSYPIFGTVVTMDHANGWRVRGVNSAKFVSTILTHPMQHGGKKLVGVSIPLSPSLRQGQRLWASADEYHAHVEFDTPFTPAILAAAPPALVEEKMAIQESLAEEYFSEAVKTLCEQAILGDYPFGGSNEVTGTSGEISEGESLHVMVSRRKTMVAQLHRGVATIPSLGDESFKNAMEIKAVIFEIFDHFRDKQASSDILPVPSDAAQDMSLAAMHSQSPSNPPVMAMRGPLTLFQYFSLTEPQPMPSKYGKYQVKKRKPAEPSLMQMQPPDIVVGHNEEWLEASPTILRFWEKLSLEPYSCKKNIQYFVVYPEGADMENSVAKLWRELSVVFETSLLGYHQPGSLQDYKPGLVPIALLPSLVGESLEAQQVRSYIDGCQRLGSILGGMSQRDVHTVIYMINPFSHGAGYFDLCRCFSIMKTQFRTAATGSLLTPQEQQRERLVLQMVPIQHVIYPSTFGGYLRFGLRDMAFTVYSKCKLFLERPSYSEGTMAQINAYAPCFALAKSTPVTIHFDVHQKPNSVPKSSATLHVGYGLSLDSRWLICVWTDHRGEMLEHLALDMREARMNQMTGERSRTLSSCLQEIWTRTRVYQKRGSFSWKTVISKLGLMTRAELMEWTKITEGTTHTSIVAVNIDSPLRLYPHSQGVDYSAAGTTPNPSGINTPNTAGPVNLGTPNISSSMSSTPLAQSLMPNSTPIGLGPSSANISTPSVSTAPATPLSGYGNGNLGTGAGTTGLGIGIAGSGANTGSHSNMGGIGGISGHETLENSAGQVFAMVLHHRIPHIVSRREILSVFGDSVRGSNEDSGSTDEKDRRNGINGDSTRSGASFASTPVDLDQDQDQNMEPSVKREPSPSFNLEGSQESSRQDLTVSAPMTDGNDVILPLATGYMIQVPIQSNSVLREKHSFEALGVEIHLLHLQRPPNPNSAISSTPVASTSDASSMALSSASGGFHSPYHHQHSGSASYQRHPSSPSTYPYRPPTFPGSSGGTAQYQQHLTGSPTMSPTASTFAGNNNLAVGGSGGVGNSVQPVKATVAQNTTREILKQFHALSYLSLAPVQTNCLPYHLVLLERLSRVLLLVQD